MSTPINWEKVLQLNSPANEAKAMLEILEQWLGVVWIPGLVTVVSITSLIASIVWQASIILIGALLSAACVALLIFWGALNVLNDARYSNNSKVEQWRLDKVHLRSLTKEQLEIAREQMQIQVKALKGSTVQVGEITNNTQNNDQKIINLDMTGVQLARHAEHFEEFLSQLPVRGAVASAWFPKDRKSYQFSDGKEISQGEYRALYRQALAAGKIVSKGKGSAARVVLDVSPSEIAENERD